MGRSSRRTFMRQISSATALAVFGDMPNARLWAATPADLLGAEEDESLLRELALIAIDAARAAGAQFADVRMTAGKAITLGCTVRDYSKDSSPQMGWPGVTHAASFGVRVIVNGAWGFASNTVLTRDAVQLAAKKAVNRARSSAPAQTWKFELAPAPKGEQGTWATPIEIDPFAVPVGEQADLAMEALAGVAGVRGVDTALVAFRWNRNLRVFASSEGALTVQRVIIAIPSALAQVRWSENSNAASEGVETLRVGPYGYETVTRANLNEELRLAAERVVIKARYKPESSAQVGRYDMVFSGSAMSSLLVETLADALNLERAAGYQANSSGTSFAAPPAEILGQYKVGSPLLTLHADRTRVKGAATVGWDDEGARPREYTLIRDGIIVDFLTNRQTAAELVAAYKARGESVVSGACASGAGSMVPGIRLPNLTMTPGTEDISEEDLIADTKKGFYISSTGAASDQQVVNTQGWTYFQNVREIRNGKLGGRISDLAFQFITPSFFQRMDAIGGRSSIVQTLRGTGFHPADPLQLPYASVDAVPARVREVNVFNYGNNS